MNPIEIQIKTRGLAALAILSLSALLHAGSVRGQDLEQAAAPDAPKDRKPATISSLTGRFLVTAPDDSTSQSLAIWAEEVARKIEDGTGSRIPFEKAAVHFEIREEKGPATNVIEMVEETTGRRLVQRLVISDIDRVDREDVYEALCRLLVNRCVFARPGAKDRKPEGGEQESKRGQQAESGKGPVGVPWWLSLGIAQNLYPSLKTRNSDRVVRMWKEGKLPPLAAVLDAGKGERPDKAFCGLFVGWLISLPEKQERFGRIFDRLAEGESVSPDWFAVCIPDCKSFADVDREWDKWLLRQKRIIYEPGVATSGMVDQLEAELLLYPGNSGIPLTSNLSQRIEFRDLIKERNAKWIKEACAVKFASLQTLAIGRGKEFSGVVEAYCRFLDALKRGKSERSVRKLLEQADAALKALREKVEKKEQEERQSADGDSAIGAGEDDNKEDNGGTGK